MRVLAEEGVLLALGTVLAVMTGIRTDAVFIAGLLLAVSVTGLVEWLHADERWPWLPCVAYLIVAAAVPAWCSFMPLVAYDMARLAAAANSHMQALALTLTALLGFVAGRSREASDGNRRALLHAQDMAREASRSVRSRIADIDEERAQSVRMATLGERTRIAREIHDNVGHLLTRAIMQAQAGRAVAEATDDEVAARGFTTLGETLDDAMTMVRRSVHDLEDDGTDFAAQIEAAVASFDGISPDFSVSLANDVDTAPAPVSRCFATVIREALANVAHHSEAHEASVTLRDFPTLWQLVVQDPGPAIRARDARGRRRTDGEPPRGMGLTDIESRVRSIGGTALYGPYDGGWRVFVSVPKQRWHASPGSCAKTDQPAFMKTTAGTSGNRGKL